MKAFKTLLITFAIACAMPAVAVTDDKKTDDRIAALEAKAKQGNTDAMNELGTIYYEGRLVPTDYVKAIKYFALAAKQKHPKAIANMGLCYQLGQGTAKDTVMAMKLYKTSIQAGNKELLQMRQQSADKEHRNFDIILVAQCAEEGIGMGKDMAKAGSYYAQAVKRGSKGQTSKAAECLLAAGKKSEAAPFVKAMADHGDSRMAYIYGSMLIKGDGVPASKTVGVQYVQKAADDIHNPNIKAVIDMAGYYFKGEGVEQSPVKALEYYKRAGAHNVAACQYNAGLLYTGIYPPVKADYDRALQWCAMSGMTAEFNAKLNDTSDKGWHETHFYNYARARSLMAATEPDYNTIVPILETLRVSGVVGANTMLGMIYANPMYKKAKHKKSMEFFDAAMAEGDARACYELAQLYRKGTPDMKADNGKFHTNLEKAAAQNYGPALSLLGDLYYNGEEGYPKDAAKSRLYLQKALDEGALYGNSAQRLASICAQTGNADEMKGMIKMLEQLAAKKQPLEDLLKALNL